MLKGHGCWVYIEHNISDEVGSLVAPVCDDRLVTELKSSYLLPTVLVALAIFLYFNKSLETTFSGHKLENWVHHKSAAELTLESWSLETWKDLQLRLLKLDRILDIKEARHFSNLLQVGLSESLFDDDVDQALGDRVVSVLKLIVQLNNSLSRLAN